MGDEELLKFMKENGISLKISEARLISNKLGRDPTLTELYIFNSEWSEHCSYKSSKNLLKMLPTTGPNVIQGPEEDAGIIHLTTIDGERYGVILAHESHNHPSQVVPYEGAATGIGGIVRDVICMGGRIIASADPLRFGDPKGKFANRTKYIANAVVDGISGYTNPIGVPNLGGDAYFNSSFDDNCLVNVVSIGLVKEKDIIHSRAPENAEGFDVIIVGKGTDNSGFGGASFASLVLDEEDEESNKGAVQVPDPFLKNVLIRATEAAFREAKKQGIEVGFKDMGAAGIMCSTSEIAADGGFGVKLDLDKVHTTMEIPSFIIMCAETQERFTWVVPPNFTPTILKIYNEDFELPNVAEGARASVIGKVTKEKQYIIKHKGKVVCNAPIDEVTSGIVYDRPYKEPKRNFKEPNLPEPDYNEMVLKVLNHPNVASKIPIYKHYDTEVQGLAVIRPGEADAGLMNPIENHAVGVALATDSNPKYGRLDPYWGAGMAVAEAMRNVAAIGAVPSGLTDCLCYGNPEKPEVFWQFVEGVRGVADAAKNIWLKGTEDPVPVVSGNVSFYNENAFGKAVDPSAIINCVGVIEDVGKAITMKIKSEGSGLYLIGERKDELGGSVYYEVNGELGANVPKVDFEKERAMIYTVIDAIDKGLVLSCHDISDGGLVTAIAEMILGGEADGKIGAEINLKSELRADKAFFSESSGFVLELDEKDVKEVENICKEHGVELVKIGETKGESLVVKGLVDLPIEKLKQSWTSGVKEALR
ncbi:MAG: phosphoribosylformylglycinamidine synthase subunit PurL [Candidatus Aenigmarchaeota archaeon]|nr:phosphoribosylformylglycinamidine synthase subunit PurL [Candidatus Aenigmarchaeota archaeon]